MEKTQMALFLTFPGRAEEAMQYYAEKLPHAEIVNIVRYGSAAPEGKEETVLHGQLSFKGQTIMFMDMNGPCPDFNWATSIYISCKNEAEFDVIFDGLSDGGTVMMGPELVGNLRKVAWVTDKFGVTWQPVWE